MRNPKIAALILEALKAGYGMSADDLFAKVGESINASSGDFADALWKLVEARKIHQVDYQFAFALVKDPCYACGGMGFVAVPGCMGTVGSEPCPKCPKGLQLWQEGYNQF